MNAILNIRWRRRVPYFVSTASTQSLLYILNIYLVIINGSEITDKVLPYIIIILIHLYCDIIKINKCVRAHVFCKCALKNICWKRAEQYCLKSRKFWTGMIRLIRTSSGVPSFAFISSMSISSLFLITQPTCLHTHTHTHEYIPFF